MQLRFEGKEVKRRDPGCVAEAQGRARWCYSNFFSSIIDFSELLDSSKASSQCVFYTPTISDPYAFLTSLNMFQRCSIKKSVAGYLICQSLFVLQVKAFSSKLYDDCKMNLKDRFMHLNSDNDCIAL